MLSIQESSPSKTGWWCGILEHESLFFFPYLGNIFEYCSYKKGHSNYPTCRQLTFFRAGSVAPSDDAMLSQVHQVAIRAPGRECPLQTGFFPIYGTRIAEWLRKSCILGWLKDDLFSCIFLVDNGKS